MTNKIANIRKEYLGKPLSKGNIHPDPFIQFNRWLEEALKAKVSEPTAMTLSTASASGKISGRIVLLKGVEENGFVFYTNYQSNKGKQIEENPSASLTFFWPELFRQVRIEGNIKKTSQQDSDQYFDSRPEESKISALASEQSKIIPDREYLEKQFEKIKQQYKNKKLLRPENWGGYILYPDTMELWQGRPNRLHDRIQYIREGNQWQTQRLAP
ncbi:MAG: pyridoxamine 5'-phosphate oxidase [Bacteroidales bacterium]